MGEEDNDHSFGKHSTTHAPQQDINTAYLDRELAKCLKQLADIKYVLITKNGWSWCCYYSIWEFQQRVRANQGFPYRNETVAEFGQLFVNAPMSEQTQKAVFRLVQRFSGADFDVKWKDIEQDLKWAENMVCCTTSKHECLHSSHSLWLSRFGRTQPCTFTSFHLSTCWHYSCGTARWWKESIGRQKNNMMTLAIVCMASSGPVMILPVLSPVHPQCCHWRWKHWM